jgi:hypothetical protein
MQNYPVQSVRPVSEPQGDNYDLLEVAATFLSEKQIKELVHQRLMDLVFPKIETTVRKGQGPQEAMNEIAHKLQSLMEPQAALDFAKIMLEDYKIDARTYSRGTRPTSLRPSDIIWLATNAQEKYANRLRR